ncbi:unnamed protein product [Brachionus calyciflorus]|uniref:Integrase catalytic domain-containing protein n=1 Tax=Brachionus calyciflorus TaxID=104777 RepID=A0A813YXR6_9BILA|nr:unnamed protein product [Brachionus calyciflorus]
MLSLTIVHDKTKFSTYDIIGTSKCSLKVKNFNGEVEVVIVKKLVYDSLLGLDVAYKMADVKSQLNSIREALGSKQLPPESYPKETKLESELPQVYRRPVNAVSETKSDPNNDPEIETKKTPKTEKDTIEMYKTILHDEFQDVLSTGFQTDLCEHKTDASYDSAGAVLSQKYKGSWRPVAYWSKRFTKAQRNYSTSEKELLALVLAIENFKQYLLGKKFIAVTDHKPLIWLKNLKNPLRNKLYEWLKSGEKPEQVDRNILEETVYLRTLHRFRVFGKNVFRCYDDFEYGMRFQYVVPNAERPDVLEKIHYNPFSGHLGIDKTFEKLKTRFYWPNYRKDITSYVAAFEVCAAVKAPKAYTRQPILPIRASKPFQKITWDKLGPLPMTDRLYVYILVIVCHFSKNVELFALFGLTAEEVADCLMLYVCRHGFHEASLSDRGTNFQAELKDQLFEILDIKRLRTSASTLNAMVKHNVSTEHLNKC